MAHASAQALLEVQCPAQLLRLLDAFDRVADLLSFVAAVLGPVSLRAAFAMATRSNNAAKSSPRFHTVIGERLEPGQHLRPQL
jgi:hypothetical protein